MNYRLILVAELALLQKEREPGFSVTLLQIVATASYEDVTRLAGSLYFKNFIRKWWTVSPDKNAESKRISAKHFYVQDEQGNHKLSQDEVRTIKQEIIGLMTTAKPNIQFQLGEAIAVIADSDFWERWDALVDVDSCEGNVDRTQADAA